MAVYFHSSIADYYLGVNMTYMSYVLYVAYLLNDLFIISNIFLGIWGGGKPKPFKFTEIQRHR